MIFKTKEKKFLVSKTKGNILYSQNFAENYSLFALGWFLPSHSLGGGEVEEMVRLGKFKTAGSYQQL